MKIKRNDKKVLIIIFISFITTFSMFNKLRLDYSLLEVANKIQNNYIVQIPYNDNIPLQIVNTFNLLKNEYVIGIVILLFCTLVLFEMMYKQYNKIKLGDTINGS